MGDEQQLHTSQDIDMEVVVQDQPTSHAAAQTITINLPTSVPVQDIHGNTLNVSVGDTNASGVLPPDYMNILDIVLDSSKVDLQGSTASIDTSQGIVLTEVNSNATLVAEANGNAIQLTQEQVDALTAAAARAEGGVSIITPDSADADTLIAAMNEMNEKTHNTLVDDTEMKDDNGEPIEFVENLEESPEKNIKIEEELKEKSSLRFKCDECERPYVTKAALKKHLQLVHNKEYEGGLQKATSKCIHPGCDKIFYHRQKMIDHLKEAHDVSCIQEDLVFSSWEEFLMWKEKEEDANFVHFSKNSTHTNAKNYMLTNFTCQREGKAGYKYKGSQQKKYKDLVIGERICPARMRARLDKPTGRVTVQYCKSHNHKLSFQDFLYRRMPDRLRNEIREKLGSGMTSEEVYKDLKSADNLRESRGERFAPSKRQFVTLVNIKTIAKRMNIKEPGPSKAVALEPEPFGIQMQKLFDETYNPVLLYKDMLSNIEVGPKEIDEINGASDLFLIGIQTREQKDMFVKHGSKIVFIDITETLISPTQYVVAVKVLDEYNKGFPVAFLITNSRDETVLFYFFREMLNRIADSDVKVSAVMTENSCNEFYAFRNVFGEDVKHLLCKWNLHRAWCQKIHEECAGDEALQQELYFIFVTMLEEMDLTKFESIATEFVNNYQTRCPNFISFFMSNYLSQPEVWASCYRNIPDSDCDEVLYADRLDERIKREIKNNRKVKTIDDILEMLLRFEHEDYFNRGLNMMLNPPEPQLILSEHELGMKIKNSSIVENYISENRWLVKTTKRDPADLQNIKEETFIVTWKADICDKDFCRERCLKLACFGLCGHLYHCSCDGDPVTPCRHIHKVHSMRIGVTQFQNEEGENGNEAQEMQTEDGITTTSALINSTVTTPVEPINSDVNQKLNLVNQVNTTVPPDPNMLRNTKIKKIKLELVKLYKFLESDNIQKYSLEFIENGLKNVLDECKVIDSIGQAKVEVGRGKRRAPERDLKEFEELVRSVKRKKSMGASAPVIVEIEPNPAIYNTFRKRITGSNEETPEDRMLRLSRSKHVAINIESDEKFRKTQSQHVTCTPEIIIAKEGEELPIVIEGEDSSVSFYQPDVNDAEWTPRGPKKRRGRPPKRKATVPKTATLKIHEITIPPLSSVSDPKSTIVTNGTHDLSMLEIKSLDINLSDEEKESLGTLLPNYSLGYVTDSVINSYLYNMTKRKDVLYLPIEQVQLLISNQQHTSRFWDVSDVSGTAKKHFIVLPCRCGEDQLLTIFVVDLHGERLLYFDPVKTFTDDVPQAVKIYHSTLVGLLVTEVPFDGSRRSWPLTSPERVLEVESCNNSIRCLWYINQLVNGYSLTDTSLNMSTFRKMVYEDVAGHCIGNITENLS